MYLNSYVLALKQHVMKHNFIYRIFGFIGLTSFLTGWLQMPLYSVPVIAAIFGLTYFLASGGWKFLRIAFLTIGRDLKAMRYLLNVMMTVKKHIANKHSVGAVFEETVSKYPNKVALINAETGSSYTFLQAEQLANQIGNFFFLSGYQKDDVIAIFMESVPEYMLYWLGLSKIGVVSALINHNLKGSSLLNCIIVSKAKAVIYSEVLSDAIAEIKDEMGTELEFYCLGACTPQIEAKNLTKLVEENSTKIPPAPKNRDSFDKLLYIFTSGTTGLPKAAVIRHTRFFLMSYGIGECFKVTDMDVTYISLPLYHSNGGVLGLGQTITRGTTAVIRKKFSASKFFQECERFNATVTYYIGETCRYLLAQPPSEHDTAHKLRVAIGNGLRPQIWEAFKNRFSIKQIGEFYGSTEGISNVINIDGKTGSVGFNSVIAPGFFPVKLLKVNRETGEILRGPDGLAIQCKYNEPGEIAGKIVTDDPLRQFDGYLNAQATSRKIVHNVFKHGDSVFLSGDTLIQDEYGYYYFHDRTGDTFRWKGENVSTTEVESTISKVLHLRDVVVYGVNIPGTEGKAGMAAIFDPTDEIDLDHFHECLKQQLPNYAKPMFVRKLKKETATTGTFKYQKTQLKKEGFALSEDPIYFFDVYSSKYRRLDEKSYRNILDFKVRF